jgi:hypothetical protein
MLTRFYLNCNDGISPDRVEQIVEEHGKNVLIGIDPGASDKPNSEGLETIKAIKEHGARLHVYLVGPGMWSWSEGERQQIKFLAKTVGIDTTSSSWKSEWYSKGWEKKAFQQFTYYHDKFNAYSCEIDNLDSSILKTDFEKYVEFYKRFSEKLKEAGVMTKLMLKNIDEDGLMLVKEAIDNGDLDREFLADWGMFEEGTGSPKKQIAICKQMGIYACTPLSGITETTRYGVVSKGVPRV